MTRDGEFLQQTCHWPASKHTHNFLDLFNTNASIVRDLAKAAADSAPNANILVISNPVSQITHFPNLLSDVLT